MPLNQSETCPKSHRLIQFGAIFHTRWYIGPQYNYADFCKLGLAPDVIPSAKWNEFHVACQRVLCLTEAKQDNARTSVVHELLFIKPHRQTIRSSVAY